MPVSGEQPLVFDIQEYANQLREGMGGYVIRSLSLEFSQGCEDLVFSHSREQFKFMLQELINNYAEKAAPDIDVWIEASFNKPRDMYKLLVWDNVNYDPEELQAILLNLKKPNSERMGKSLKIKPEASMAKVMIQDYLRAVGGKLKYAATPMQSVVAIATWQRAKFLNPPTVKSSFKL